MKRRISLIIFTSILIVVLLLVLIIIIKNKTIKDENGFYLKTTTINEKKEKYNNPYIPQGFKPINTEISKWDEKEITEESLSNGLVIEDNMKNQFVWIPVDGKKIELSRKIFKQEEIINVNTEDAIDRIYYSEENINSCLTKYKILDEEKYYSINSFKESVKEYGGFYIARFETGIDDQKQLVVKEGYLPQTNITRDEALDSSIKYLSNNLDVVSSLVNSYAWDTTLEFISNKNREYCFSKENVGNGNISYTGKTNDVECNIYDLSGNVREWSTEYSSNGYYSYLSSCVVRGGYYNNSNFVASSRYYNGENAKNEFIGYRMIIYKKKG